MSLTAGARCPYCDVRAPGAALRRHFALALCPGAPSNAALPFPEGVTEDSWRKEAENIARELGWLVAHVERSRPRPGQWITNTVAGFPDSWFAWPAGGLLVIEFKSAKGKPTPEQVAWILALDRTAGVKARVYGPDDWPKLQRLLTAHR